MEFNIFENIPKSVDEITPEFLRKNFVYDEYKVRSSLLRKSNFKKNNQLPYYAMLRTLCNECESMDDMVRRICNITAPVKLIEFSAEKHNIKDYILTYLCFPGTTEMIAQRLLTNVLIKYNLLETLEHYYTDSSCIHETVYRIINDIDVRPVCKECGGPVSYSKQYHFAGFCSKKCQNSNTEMRQINSQAVSKALGKTWHNRRKERLAHGEKITTKKITNIQSKQNRYHYTDDIKQVILNMMSELGFVLNHNYLIFNRNLLTPYRIDILLPFLDKGIIFSKRIVDNDKDEEIKDKILNEAEINEIEIIFIYEQLLFKKPEVVKQYITDFIDNNITTNKSTLI